MCGRFTQTFTAAQIQELFPDYDLSVPAPPRFNVAPTQPVLALLHTAPRRIVHTRWGLIPAWAKSTAAGARLINARAETLDEKPAFRAALQGGRCVILADGFYEWKSGQPHYFQVAGGAPFGLAGLWSTWTAPAGETIRSSAIITTAANDLVAPVHGRMPVILRPAEWPEWLASPARGLLRPFPPEAMEVRPVGPRVNAVQCDDPACLAPAACPAWLPGLDLP